MTPPHRIPSDNPDEHLWQVEGHVVCRYCRFSFDSSTTLTYHPTDDNPPPDQDCENCGRIGARWVSYDPVPSDIPDAEDSELDPWDDDDDAP